jgi:Xaa-Pro aminopeptidase
MAPATASARYLSVHEGPQRIAKTGTEKLLPGMILSNEPGYYKEGAYGIRWKT